MASSYPTTASINRLLSHLTIHVSGIPTHSEPMELFYPQHHPYQRHTMRPIASDKARDGFAVVRDMDVMALWRLPSVVAAYEVFF